MSISDPANLGGFEPQKTQADPEPPTGTPDRELRALFYREEDTNQVAVTFQVMDYHDDIPDSEQLNIVNQLLAIADNTWLGTLPEQNPEILDEVMEDKIHAIFHAFPNEEEGKKWLSRVSEMVKKLEKSH